MSRWKKLVFNLYVAGAYANANGALSGTGDALSGAIDLSDQVDPFNSTFDFSQTTTD
jgi:hypothetical protein